MKRIRQVLIVIFLSAILTGCGMGILYTHTMQPLSLDEHKTRIVQKDGQGDIKHIVLFNSLLSVAWDDAAIGDIAKKSGLKEIYFADLETLKILTIWNQYTVHVYGQ